MCKNDVLVLTLDSTAFSKMKEDFNSILKKTLVDYKDATEDKNETSVVELPAPKRLLEDKPHSDYEYDDGGNDE